MSSGEARYSKVTRRMWNDADFRELSAPPPNGQSLWQRLLTGPELTCIPGLFPAWEAGLADALRWPLEGFREAFLEVSSKGMAKADWKAGLVWVPKAPKHNKPASPNVILSWGSVWEELPECDLKEEAYRHLRAFAEGWGEAFLKAFDQAIPESGAGTGSGSRTRDLHLGRGSDQPARGRDTTPPARTAPPENIEITEAIRARCAIAGAPLPTAADVQHCLADARAKGHEREDWGAHLVGWMIREKNIRARVPPGGGAPGVRAGSLLQARSEPRAEPAPGPDELEGAQDEMTEVTQSIAGRSSRRRTS